MSLGDGNFKDLSANSIIIDGSLGIYGDISGDGYLHVYDASFRNDVTIANNLVVEHDVSINNYLSAVDTSFHNDVIIGSNLDIERDVSINHQLDAYDASFHNDVTISNDLVIKNDVSVNNYLSAMGASFHNNVTIAKDLVVGNDVFINHKLDPYDASFRNNVTIAMDLVVGNDVSINNYLSAMDASFHHDVTIAKDLYVENDVSINHHLDAYDASFHNNVTIAMDLVVGNDVSINNYLSAMDSSFHNDVTIAKDLYVENDVSINHRFDAYDASFHNNVTIANNLVIEHDVSINSKLSVIDSSFHNNVTIARYLVVENDVSINHHLDAYDASFHRDVPIVNDLVIEHDVSINNILDAYDASFHNDVTVTNNLVIEHDVSINTYLSAMDTSFHNDVTIVNDLVVEHDISVNGRLDAFDVSFHNNLIVDNDISCGGVLKAPQVFAGTGPFVLDVLSQVILAGGGGLNGMGGTNNVNGTATASSVWGADWAASKAFDNNTVTAWHSEPLTPPDDAPTAAEQWIEFEFPYDVIITKYDICPRYNGGHANPLTWTLDGMVGTTATTIHTSPTLVQNDWIPHTYKSFNVTDTTTAYDRIRLNINSAVQTGATRLYTNIGDIIYYGYRLSPPVFVGSNSNSDAVMRLEGADGSGCEIVGSGSGDNRFGINIINDAATSKSNALTISKQGNVGINNTSPTVKLDVGGSIAATDISGIGMVPIGGIIMWNSNTIPDGWVLCNGGPSQHGVAIPDMSDKFVMGVGAGSGVGESGGVSSATLTSSHMPKHNHTITFNPSSNTLIGDHAGTFEFADAGNHGQESGRSITSGEPSGATITSDHKHTHQAWDYYMGEQSQGEWDTAIGEGYVDILDTQHWWTVTGEHGFWSEDFTNTYYAGEEKPVWGTVSRSDLYLIPAGTTRDAERHNASRQYDNFFDSDGAHVHDPFDTYSGVAVGDPHDYKDIGLEASKWDSDHIHKHQFTPITSAYNNEVDSTATSYENVPRYIILAYIIRVY